MLAAQNGRQDIVEMLHSGADPHLRDKNGSRPLYMQKTRDMPALDLRRAGTAAVTRLRLLRRFSPRLTPRRPAPFGGFGNGLTTGRR